MDEHWRICQPGTASDNIDLDPEFASLIPALTTAELARLHRSLDAEQGCRDPLIVWRGTNILVHGYNRIRHCRKKGYPFPVIEREFADREAARAFIIKEQLSRRNLSAIAESYLRGLRYLGGRRRGKRFEFELGFLNEKQTSEQLALEYCVAEKTIRRDGDLALAIEIIARNCGPECRNELLTREARVSRNRILRLAKLPADKQQEFIDELKATGKPPPIEVMGKKSVTLPCQPKELVQALLKKIGVKGIAEILRELRLVTPPDIWNMA